MNKQDNRLKVLELIDDAEVGGGQRHVLLLAEGLRRHGLDVAVACAPEGYLVDRLREMEIPVLSVRLSNRFRPGQLFRLMRILRNGHFDIVHTHGGTAGLWGRLAAFFAGVPVRIHTYHGIHSIHRGNPIVRWLFLSIERFLLSVTSYIICVSHGDRNVAEEHSLLRKRRTTVILNGIEVDRFTSSSGRERIRSEFGCTDGDILVGAIGRLHVQKGLVYLIDAAAIVLQHHKNVKFVLVGDGPLRGALHERASEQRVSSALHFAGTRHDVPDLLAAFDIFVSPSLWEGLPLVLLEASAAGKAIIATDVDGTREIIHDGANGILVSSENSHALAEAILKLCSEPSLRQRIGTKAREIACARYSVGRMVEETLRLYSQLMTSHGVS